MSNAPAGWYPDPDDVAQLRHWDGTQWTNQCALVSTPDPATRQKVRIMGPLGWVSLGLLLLTAVFTHGATLSLLVPIGIVVGIWYFIRSAVAAGSRDAKGKETP